MTLGDPTDAVCPGCDRTVPGYRGRGGQPFPYPHHIAGSEIMCPRTKVRFSVGDRVGKSAGYIGQHWQREGEVIRVFHTGDRQTVTVRWSRDTLSHQAWHLVPLGEAT